jgi:methionyl aminopeptidase
MILKNQEDKKTLRRATEISTTIVKTLSEGLAPGVYPAEIEKYCWDLCKKYEVEPAFYGVTQTGNAPFPSSCNISVNDEILHAIPSATRKLKVGDVVKVDFGAKYKGFYTDQCFTFIIAKPKPEDTKLVRTAKLATENTVELAIIGAKTGDLGHSMQSIAEMSGYEILKNYVGHGIGKRLWEDPQIPAYGTPGKGQKLEKDMVICVECQLVEGTDETFISEDGWTIKTENGANGAMFEYMVIVGKDRPEILTPMQNWEIVV